MALINPRSMNAANTIIVCDYDESLQEDGSYSDSISLEPGNPDYDKALAGDFGEVAIYSQEDDLSYVDPIVEYRNNLKCSRLQAKAVLHQYNMLDGVDAMVANSDFIVQLAWQEAAVFERNSIVVSTMKEFLKWPDGSALTDEELDELFEAAKQIQF